MNDSRLRKIYKEKAGKDWDEEAFKRVSDNVFSSFRIDESAEEFEV